MKVRMLDKKDLTIEIWSGQMDTVPAEDDLVSFGEGSLGRQLAAKWIVDHREFEMPSPPHYESSVVLVIQRMAEI